MKRIFEILKKINKGIDSIEISYSGGFALMDIFIWITFISACFHAKDIYWIVIGCLLIIPWILNIILLIKNKNRYLRNKEK